MLFRIQTAAVVKCYRSPFCIDRNRAELLAHPVLDSVFNTPEHHWRPLLTNIIINHQVDLRGRCLLLDSRYGKEFYHFMTSVLGRAARYLSFRHNFSAIDYFLVPESTKYAAEALDILGIPESKRIHLSEQMLVLCDELLVPTNVREADFTTIAFLNSLLLRTTIETPQLPKRIFISRRLSANGRALADEEKLFTEALQPHGFVSLQLEDHDLATQAKFFNSATHVVGAHGGGFTNIVYSREHTKILEFFHPAWISFCYARIGSMVGASNFYHTGDSGDSMNIRLGRSVFNEVIENFLKQ